jgi:hypothetical protein
MRYVLQEVEAALQCSQGTAAKQLQALHGRCMLQLEDLVDLIRGPLSDLERRVSKRMPGAPKRSTFTEKHLNCA